MEDLQPFDWSLLPDRFWEKVNRNGPVPTHRPDLGPCWIWTGSKVRNGYGQWRRNRRTDRSPRLTHKETYEIFVGPVPEELELDHLCRVHDCCNPQHLEAVTRQENSIRGDRFKLKTHCSQGHEYTKENTYTFKRGPYVSRDCRTCRAARVRKFESKGVSTL